MLTNELLKFLGKHSAKLQKIAEDADKYDFKCAVKKQSLASYGFSSLKRDIEKVKNELDDFCLDFITNNNKIKNE